MLHDQDHCSAADLAAADTLIRQQPAERQREDDRRDEERLDDREPAAVERAGLGAFTIYGDPAVSRPTWHVVVAIISLVVALGGAVLISLSSQPGPEPEPRADAELASSAA